MFKIYRETERRGVIGSIPSKAVVVEAPAGVSLADAIYAPAAMFGGEGELVQWRPRWRRVRRGGVAGIGGASYRWQRPFSRSG